MIQKIKALTFILLLCLSFSLLAAVPQWEIEPAKSSITFTATQNNAPVKGEFKKFNGEVFFDPTQLDASHVSITVDISSISTSFSDVAETLKSSDWFNINKFPQATFKATQFKKTGEKTYQADGKLTLRDKTIPIILFFVVDEFSPTNAHSKGFVTLKRTQFGIGKGEWSNTDVIKDDVLVNFEITAKRGK